MPAKGKIAYICSSCGTKHPKWTGQCNECGIWNSLSETKVDQIGVQERVARLQSRSIKNDSKKEALTLALSMIDLTTLEGRDSPNKVRQLCYKATHLHESFPGLPHVAAICVYAPMIKTAKQILALPRAKSNPPQPPNLSPQTINTITETAIDDWGIALTRWSEENDHLPKGNRPPVDKLVENMKNRRNHLLQYPDGVPQRAPQQVPQQVQQNTVNTPQSVNTLDAKVQALEVKITKLMDHFGVK